MIDHIKKEGFLYRNAYPFSDLTEARRCVMWLRLPVFGLLRIAASLGLWILGAVICGILPWVTVGLYRALMGKKFVYAHYVPTSWVIGDRVLSRLVYVEYDCRPMENLPVIAGVRVLPLYPVTALVVALVLWTWWPSLVTDLATIAGIVWTSTSTTASAFMEYNLWIPAAIVGTILALALIDAGIRKYYRSKTYQDFRKRLTARFDKVCPIKPVR